MAHGGRAAARDPNSAADAAATQNTLNYALGNLGGRQKAWMSSGQAIPSSLNFDSFNSSVTKRKPGRPPKPRPRELRQKPQYSPTVEARHDYHVLSNSTSPQLANVLSHPTASRTLAAPTAVLPSPSPSEEATVEHTSAPTALHLSPIPSTDGAQETATVRNDYVPARDTSLDITFMEGSRQPTSAHKRPAEADGAGVDKRSRVGQQARTNPPSLRTDNLRRASFQLPGQGESANPSPGPLQSQMPSPYLSHSIPHGMQDQDQAQLQAGRTQPQGQSPFGPHGSLSRELPRQQPSVVTPYSRDSNPVHQASNQRETGAPLDWYTKLYCIEILELFLTTTTIPPDHPCDGKRLGVLRDAIEQEDWAYLTMHQYYCILTANPEALPAGFLNNLNLPNAVRLMRDVLGSNDLLSPAVLHFFANFPMTLARLGEMFPQRFEQEALMFFNFMQQSVNFEALKALCQQRNCPPLMRELVYDLGITSTVFQRIVFTASFRRLSSMWGGPGQPTQTQYELKATNLFSANQSQFYRHEASRSNNQPVDFDRERELERQQWGSQLKQLCDGALQQCGSFLLGTASQVPQQTQRPYPQNHHIPQSPTTRPPAQATLVRSPHSAQAATQRGRGRGRPRLYPTPHRPQPAPSNQQVARRLEEPSFVALLPARGVHQPQQRQPNPSRFGLHQAHLRSPLLQAKSREQKLYQYMKGFLKAPVRLIDAGHKIEKWTFTLTGEELQRVPKNLPNTAGAPPIRVIDENSQLLRIRCVKWTSSEVPDEHAWAAADTSWIPHSYFTLNGQNLQPRKKMHHGKDLPVDISPFVQEGENKLEIAIMRHVNDENYRKYLVAIEILAIKSHDAIIKDCQQNNHISASTTMKRIRQKLSDPSGDDDIIIVENNLTISLFDPFSASKICDIPARGKACLHYDCFDLDTFLQTREKKGDATVADQWKCPICNCDARPQHLVVDGFLEDVRAKLYEQGWHDTRAIVVGQDGSWKPKAEIRDPDGVQDAGAPDDDHVLTRPQRQPSVHAKVIDLSG